jgi:hypothetical protein
MLLLLRLSCFKACAYTATSCGSLTIRVSPGSKTANFDSHHICLMALFDGRVC